MNKIPRDILWEMLRSNFWIYSFPWEFDIFQYVQYVQAICLGAPAFHKGLTGVLGKFGFLCQINLGLRKTAYLLSPFSHPDFQSILGISAF